MTNFHLNIRDTWLALPDVDADIPKELDRPRSSMTLLGGARFEQFAPKASASWSLDQTLVSADATNLLRYAASSLAGELWLLDVQAAQANMLDETQTQGASATLVTVDGVPMPAFAASATATRKVRAGVAYQLSYTTTHTAATTIGTYDLGAGAVNIVAPAGTGARRGSVAFIPATDGTVTITWTVADKTSGARLSEGSVASVGFLPGENTPCRVVVSDPAQSIGWVYTDRLSRGNFSWSIREVGQ